MREKLSGLIKGRPAARERKSEAAAADTNLICSMQMAKTKNERPRNGNGD